MDSSKKTFIYVLVCWFLAVISIQFIDRRLALFLHESTIDNWLVLRYITEYFIYLFPCMIISLIFYKLSAWLNRVNFSAFILCVIYFFIMLEITMLLKTALKIFFGRYWPTTWIQNNPSLINNGIYGFNWWHGLNGVGSFPSGHSTLCFFCYLWLIQLNLVVGRRMLWLFMFVPFCLVLLNYHYLGDCLAGVGLGLMCGHLSIMLYKKLLAQS